MNPVENEVVEGTGNALIDNMVVEAILTAQRMNQDPKELAVAAVEALHGAVTRWNTLILLEVPE